MFRFAIPSRGFLCAFALVAASQTVSAPAAAKDPQIRAQAEEAWARGDFEASEKLYKKLVEFGFLETGVLVQSYVRLGACRSLLGRKEDAIKAFRAASVLEPNFQTPPEGGQKALDAAQLARSSVQKLGPLVFEAKIPDKLEAGAPVRVTATVDQAHLPMVTRVQVLVKLHDKENAVPVKTEEPPSPGGSTALSIDELPRDMKGEVDIEVSALDKHFNRLATQRQVRTIGAVPVLGNKLGEGPDASGSVAEKSSEEEGKEGKSKHPLKPSKSDGVSFWSTPWPYVVGGIALAAGGASVYYFTTRPPDMFTVSRALVETR
jgi:hypothetical protein